MKNRILPLSGAILFLLAQILLPQGTADVSVRIANIRQDPLIWNLGHALVMMSVPLMMLGFVRLRELVRLLSPGSAVLGLWLLLLGLCSEVSIAGLQIVTEGIVRTSDGELARQVLATGMGTKTVLLAMFLPFTLLLPGALLLALPLLRAKNYLRLSIGILLFGILMLVAGMLQVKAVFIAAALAGVYIFWMLPDGQVGFGATGKGAAACCT